MDIDGLEIIQSRPGQLSLAIAKLKGNQLLAQELQARFGNIPGITRVEADHNQGEVKVSYYLEELTSLPSLLALKETMAFFFPEINPLKLAAYLSQFL